jgi:hypothetical protein
MWGKVVLLKAIFGAYKSNCIFAVPYRPLGLRTHLVEERRKFAGLDVLDFCRLR